MKGRTQLVMGRRQIQAIIDSDSVEIVLRRQSKVPTPAGGWKYGVEVPLEPQTVALIPFKRRMTDFLVNTELGEVADLPYVLLGSHTLDVEPRDRFTYDNKEFEVKTVDIKTDERVAAQVDYYGASNG